MMITAEYYTQHWDSGYSGDTDELTAALERAEMIVDREIFLSGYSAAAVPDVLRDAVSRAVCAQAEFIIENGGVSALSETSDGSVSLGKFSYSGGAGTKGASAANQLCGQACALLEPTGLLFRGVSL